MKFNEFVESCVAMIGGEDGVKMMIWTLIPAILGTVAYFLIPLPINPIVGSSFALALAVLAFITIWQRLS